MKHTLHAMIDRAVFNRFFVLSLLCLLVQQLIVAGSTYLTGKIAESIFDQQHLLMYVSWFIVSLFIVYLPAMLSAFFLDKAKFSYLGELTRGFHSTFYNQTGLRNHKQHKDALLPYISSESYFVTDEYYGFLHDWLSVMLNVAFNIVVFSVILSADVLVYYGVAFVLVYVLIKRTDDKIEATSDAMQKDRTRLQRVLSLSWDNILIGNRYNAQHHQQAVAKTLSQSQQSTVTSTLWNESVSSIGMACVLIPVTVYLLSEFYTHLDDQAYIAVLVATLPRQITVLQYISTIVSYFVYRSAIETKRRAVLSAMQTLPEATPNTETLRTRIDWAALSITTTQSQAAQNQATQHQITLDAQQFDMKTQRDHLPTSGRFTVRGRNGAGKSTLLLMIKQSLGDRAFYLPANGELHFQHDTHTINQTDRHHSTGEAMIANLTEILDHVTEIDVLLLDEWDANLDTDNTNQLDTLINTLSQRITVIEVRH